MKKIPLLSFFLIAISLNVFAQNSIINSHFFKAGVEVEYQVTYDSLVTFEDYGNKLIWDYSKLPPKEDSYRRSVQASEETPHANKFPEANVAIVGKDKDYVYLNVTPNKTEFIAFVPPDSSYFVYNYQAWSISVHPMNFGDSIKAPIARYIKVGDRTVYREGTIETTAIGFGKLILPNATYENVLKIKEVQTFYNPSRTTFYQATTYHWLSNTYNFPLMSCNIIVDRNSKGEEQINQFAQYLVLEKNTNKNTLLQEIEKNKPASKMKEESSFKKTRKKRKRVFDR